MLDFIKNIFKSNGQGKNSSSTSGAAQATVAVKPVPEESTAAPEGEAPVFRIGQTVRVPGLGDFTVHDIKGGKGKSGMGVVYIVLDVSSMTPYAVKTFQKWVLGTPDLIQ